MGLILDTCILIAGERRGEGVEDILRLARMMYGENLVALSAVSVVELTHGIYRARTDTVRERRQTFVSGVYHDLVVYPVTTEIAQLAGRIEGELAAQGKIIPFEDLVIGTTALYLGFELATSNVKHFERIAGLKIVSL